MVRYPVLPTVPLAKNPTLDSLQVYVKQMTADRGLAKHDPYAHFGILCERIGQLSHAIRIYQEVRTPANEPVIDVHGELANVLWEVMVVANEVDINMADALRRVEKTNRYRVWL